MGHGITALKDLKKYRKFWDNYKDFNKPVPREDLEVAYLRRGMMNGSIRAFYLYLGCQQYNGGVSGNGETPFISLDKLKLALERFKHNAHLFDGQDYTDYTEFLMKCIEFCRLKKKKGIVISFS